MKLGLRRIRRGVVVPPVGLRWHIADLDSNSMEYIHLVERVLTEGLGRRIAIVAYEMEEPPNEDDRKQ
jgi:hypothetical protein